MMSDLSQQHWSAVGQQGRRRAADEKWGRNCPWSFPGIATKKGGMTQYGLRWMMGWESGSFSGFELHEETS